MLNYSVAELRLIVTKTLCKEKTSVKCLTNRTRKYENFLPLLS